VPVSQRKRLGAWYTPAELVDAVVAEVLPGVVERGSVVRVLDPACGDGRFLVAVAAALRARGARAELTGVDVDPQAPAFGDPQLAGCELIVADALTYDWGDRTFDVVVGNPPFLNQMATATSRGGSSRFGGGPYADVAAEFLALAVHLVAPHGRIGLVLPQSLLASRDAAAIRASVDAAAVMRWLWWSPTLMFDAFVRTWAGVWEAGPATGPVSASGSGPVTIRRSTGPGFTVVPSVSWAGSWSGLIAGVDPPPRSDADAPTLGSIATFTADFRDHYYGLVPAVSDRADGPPLITSGLIDPGRCLWGERPMRFAKQRFAAPRVDLALLSPVMQRWAQQRLVPKVLVANQTTVIEAVLDAEGAWLPGVPVITCTSSRLAEVLEVLQSSGATEWVRYHAAGSGLSATAVRLTPSLLASIPLPLPPRRSG
jgi:SAM-dependent methyltransferase